MVRYFNLKEIQKTTSYTPNRYFMLYEKKKKPAYHLNSLPVKKHIKKDDFDIFHTKNGLVAKVLVVKPSTYQIWNDLTRVRLACESPITNGMDGEIYIGNRLVGWVEKKATCQLYSYFENERELWNKICEHNVFLAKNGHFDLDSATINFTKKGQLIDKSCVFPIKKLLDVSIDVYPLLFRQSYRSINREIPNKIVSAAKTRNSKLLEKTFMELTQYE
jgi:hypothetical protein